MVMNEKVEKLMNEQINAELYSAYLYQSMAAYFESVNLTGFARWMEVQALEEMTHAQKFYRHINERAGRVLLKAMEAPPVGWNSPLHIFEESYKHEQKVTALINNIVKVSNEEKDYASQSLLQWFVDEQVEEEDSTDQIVQKLRMIKDNPGALYMLDKELGARTFTPPKEKSKE
ncbi:ferritin [Candidatus Woesearchaeota archaeon]|nr:ferritin [Candidatus Woesearchaeota archaeon]